MQLSKNFSLDELIKSDTAIRLGINNTPNTGQIKNLELLAKNILQPLRDKFGSIKILSGFRSPELNKAVNGSKTSDHMDGLAADIECKALSNAALASWIKGNLTFEQLILEFYTPGDSFSGWVHVSYGNKQQILTAHKENGKTIYTVGLKM